MQSWLLMRLSIVGVNCDKEATACFQRVAGLAWFAMQYLCRWDGSVQYYATCSISGLPRVLVHLPAFVTTDFLNFVPPACNTAVAPADWLLVASSQPWTLASKLALVDISIEIDIKTIMSTLTWGQSKMITLISGVFWPCCSTCASTALTKFRSIVTNHWSVPAQACSWDDHLNTDCIKCNYQTRSYWQEFADHWPPQLRMGVCQRAACKSLAALWDIYCLLSR